MEFGGIFRTKKRALPISEKGPFHDYPITHAAGKNNLLSSRWHIFSCRSITVPASPQIICRIAIRFCGCSMGSARLSRNRCTQHHPPRGGRC